MGLSKSVEDLLSRQKELLEQLENTLARLQLSNSFEGFRASCEHLQNRLNHEEFRVALVGEFSAGKSTLINTLLGDLELLPTHDLPCTSQVIEIHYGLELSCREFTTGKVYPDVKTALKQHTTLSTKKKKSVHAHRWLVELSSPLLTQGLGFIDTPGLAEDKKRKELAFEEAKKADAVVLVTRGPKLGSGEEAELVEYMVSLKKPVILAINRIDELRSKPDRFRERAIDIFPEIRPDHIILLSALKAGEELHSLSKTKWSNALHELQRVISVVLRENSAGERIRLYQGALEKLGASVNKELDVVLTKRNQDGKEVKRKIEIVERKLHQGIAPLQKALKESFHSAWPGILKSLDEQKSNWKSGESPITSPKVFAKEIAEQAKRYIEKRVQSWANTQGKRVTERKIQQKFDDIEPVVSEITAYLNTSGKTENSLKNNLLNRVMQTAFNKSIDNAADDAAWATIVAAVISVIVGYIIADVILFYVLALISGFLNPFLLIAAAVVGLGAFVFGADWVGDYVKSKIAEKIQEELAKPEAIEKINEGFEKAAKEVFGPLSRGFGVEARQMQKEVEQRVQEAVLAAREIKDALAELHALFEQQ